MELCGQEERAALAVACYRPPDREGPGLCLWAAHGRGLCEVEEVAQALWHHALLYRLLGAYQRHLPPAVHCPGKRHTQRIERKHLTLRTRIKRLVRKTICFSKSIVMHDIVIGLFINRYEFGMPV